DRAQLVAEHLPPGAADPGRGVHPGEPGAHPGHGRHARGHAGDRRLRDPLLPRQRAVADEPDRPSHGGGADRVHRRRHAGQHLVRGQAVGRGGGARGREGVAGCDRVPHPDPARVRMGGVSGTGRAPDGGMDAAGRPGARRESAEATSRGERTREHAASVGPAGATGDTDPTRRPEAAGGAADATSPETMREQHTTVPRTARYYTLGRAGPELGQVWFVCHGYGQLAARFIRRFRGLDNGRRLIVAPEALSRFYVGDHGGPHGPESRVGATWMTREDRLREIDDYVRYLDLLHDHVMAGADR